MKSPVTLVFGTLISRAGVVQLNNFMKITMGTMFLVQSSTGMTYQICLN